MLSLHWLKLAPVLVPAMLTLGVAGAIAVRRRRARRAPAAAPAAAPGLRLDPVALRPLARDAVLERLSDPVVVVDLEGRLVDLNPAAAQLLGAGPAAADGAFDPRRLQGWAAVAEALDGAALVRRPGPGATGLFPRETALAAIRQALHARPQLIPLNERALAVGWEAGEGTAGPVT